MIINISSDALDVSVSSFGAELHSVKDKSGTEYLWQANPEFWKRHAPVLFPFIGPLKDGSYTHNGTEYKMTSHGFARDNEFSLLESGENFVSFILKGDVKKDIYPFDFDLIVKYTVEGKTVTTSMSVKNTGCEKMYFYIGGHPAFRCPIFDGEDFTDYVVEFEKPEFIEQPLLAGGKRVILNNETTVALSHELFDNDVFMKSKANSKKVSLINKSTGKGVRVNFDGCDTIAVWSPASEAEFVCLEPWSSIPSINDESPELSEKKLAIVLAPNEEYHFGFSAEIL